MLYARGDDGVNVDSLATVSTEPATLPPMLLSLKVSVVMPELLMVMLNAAVTTVFVPTPVAPLEGLTRVTFRSVPPPVGVGVGAGPQLVLLPLSVRVVGIMRVAFILLDLVQLQNQYPLSPAGLLTIACRQASLPGVS